MPLRKRLFYPLRLPYRLLMSPLRRPSYPRLAFVTLNGSPLEIRGRARAILLLRRMHRQNGLSRTDANRLIQLLNRYPRAIWTNTLGITWRNDESIRQIHWWNKEGSKKVVKNTTPSRWIILGWPVEFGHENFRVALMGITEIMIAIMSTRAAFVTGNNWWLVATMLATILYLMTGCVLYSFDLIVSKTSRDTEVE